jgi:hypothetical protein
MDNESVRLLVDISAPTRLSRSHLSLETWTMEEHWELVSYRLAKRQRARSIYQSNDPHWQNSEISTCHTLHGLEDRPVRLRCCSLSLCIAAAGD